MAPDASTSPVEWGPEIPVHGRRPKWLDADEPFLPCSGPGPHREWSCAYSDHGIAKWDLLDAIRLPADHPHYLHSTTPERDPLWERMEALVRDIGEHSLQTFVYSGDATALNGWIVKARGIVADLPKPVDPDDDATKQVLDDLGWALGSQPLDDVEPLAIFNTVKAAIKRGRELAAPEVSHVG